MKSTLSLRVERGVLDTLDTIAKEASLTKSQVAERYLISAIKNDSGLREEFRKSVAREREITSSGLESIENGLVVL